MGLCSDFYILPINHIPIHLNPTVLKREHIHGADRDTNTALDARSIFIRKTLLIFGKTHDVDADFTVARAFIAGNTFFIAVDSQAAEFLAPEFHPLCQGAPVAAPDFAAEKWVKGDGDHTDQPEVCDVTVPIAGFVMPYTELETS